jgi:hypothetical protein
MFEERAVILEKIGELESKIDQVQRELHKDDYLGESFHRKSSELQRLEDRLNRLYTLLCTYKGGVAQEYLAALD